MKRVFKYYFDKWWRPILIFGITVLIMVLCEFTNIPELQDFSFLLFFIGFLGLLISTIYQFAKKRWTRAIFTILIIGFSIVGFFYYSIALFWKDQSVPDHFADNLTIPHNLIIYQPTTNNRASTETIDLDSNAKSGGISNSFELYDGGQPGIYNYSIYLGKIDNGTIFLKAYEITNNYRLSKTELKKRSSIRVLNHEDTIKRFETKKGFTIYEGDWGKPYAARFEVWYKPDSGTGTKLTEKNFKIEGWQR